MLNLLKIKDVTLMKWDIQMYIATEAVIQRCSGNGVLKICSKFTNIHAEVQFQ